MKTVFYVLTLALCMSQQALSQQSMAQVDHAGSRTILTVRCPR